ncbi:hypothetical protein MMC07_003498 [Pseudocyphellaria aurata]|nr:hypothetical protein [Pseudocyphellaria aurata]
MSYQSVSLLSDVTPRGACMFSPQLMSPGYKALAQSEHSASENTPSAGQNQGQEHGRNGEQSPVPESKARLRKACDSCSIRKVKCDEAGPPCRACAGLDIPCTFDRPSRRRGPPNRLAEAIKRRRVDSPGTSGTSAPSSPTHAAQTLASFAQQHVVSAEAILPFPMLQLLLDDYFTYLHPMTPVPHEPSFRAALARREDLSNPTFLALLASMVGCLVAAFPRRPRLYLKDQKMGKLVSNSTSLIDRCHKIAVDACGLAYLDKNFTVHDAIISYLQGLIGAYTFNWQSCRAYFGQCLTISRTIGLHQAKGSGHADCEGVSSGLNGASQESTTDLILQELGRRTFWIMFVAIKSLHRLGVSCAEVCIPPATPKEPYPPLPLEVDDAYLESNRVLSQPHDTISMMTAFNTNVRIFSTYDTLATAELVYGVDEIFDWDRQKSMLGQCLHALKQILEILPHELKHDPESRSALQQEDHFSHLPHLQPSGKIGNHNDRVPSDRRRTQIEIQKAELYASQLGTRSYLVEKYWNLHDANQRRQAKNDPATEPSGILAAGLGSSPPCQGNHQNSHLDLSDDDMFNEREEVVQNLSNLLGSMCPVDLDLNGVGFINNLRRIATPLLDATSARKGPRALRADCHLPALLKVLTKLERSHLKNTTTPSAEGNGGGAGGGHLPAEEDQEAEVDARHWAELRTTAARLKMALMGIRATEVSETASPIGLAMDPFLMHTPWQDVELPAVSGHALAAVPSDRTIQRLRLH